MTALLSIERLSIERLGQRGEGVARLGDRRVFVPYALEGETVRAEVDGEQARLVEIVAASPDRVAPFCPHFSRCGGCAVQALRPDAYARWKRELVENALRNAGLTIDVEQLVDAHGDGRRRVTFHARRVSGKARVGFMAARTHEIVEIDACPLLAPGLAGALPAARDIAGRLAARDKPLDIAVTATDGGLDIELRGPGPLDERETASLIEAADAHDLARLANHGRLVVLRRAPEISVGAARVTLPPGSFLQATLAGEEALVTRVLAATQGAKKVADLFCGIGSFALRLGARSRVAAYDSDAAAIEALGAGARRAKGLRKVEAVARDLFRRPLDGGELAPFDAIVFDPPRAGAVEQARAIAQTAAPVVVAVSCNAQSFTRDAKILVDGGYVAQGATPIDQFRHSAHVEIVAIFARAAASPRTKRRLLG